MPFSNSLLLVSFFCLGALFCLVEANSATEEAELERKLREKSDEIRALKKQIGELEEEIEAKQEEIDADEIDDEEETYKKIGELEDRKEKLEEKLPALEAEFEELDAKLPPLEVRMHKKIVALAKQHKLHLAPLANNDQLYSMADLRNAVQNAKLDAATGSAIIRKLFA